MGGRSKNLCSVEVAAVVDLSLDDVDTDEMDRSDLFQVLPDNDESDDDDELQCPDAEINVIIQQAKYIEKRWRLSDNTNLRGRGTSRSTYYAGKNKTEKLQESGRNTQQIAQFFVAPQDIVDIGEHSAVPEALDTSVAEPADEQNSDDGNQTDDEVTFAVSKKKLTKVVNLSKEKEIEEMQ